MSIKRTKITLLLLPNQLFNPELIHKLVLSPYIHKSQTNIMLNIIMLEHPVFFGLRKPYGQMKFNKLKLLYQMTAIRYYLEYTFRKYIESNTSNNDSIKLGTIHTITNDVKWIQKIVKYTKNTGTDVLFYFDPVDMQISREYVFIQLKLLCKCIELDNPGFINTKAQLQEYHNTKKNRNSYFHAGFYQYQRVLLGDEYLKGSKTYDIANRDKLPLTENIPDLAQNDNANPNIKDILVTVSNIINKHPIWSSFPGSCEPVSTILQFPITHETSIKWLNNFCRTKLAKFGKYQDAIDGNGRNYLFHSCISPMLNIGLLTPIQVIETVQEYYKTHKDSIPMASYEGFIRQVIGWREYQRYIYIYAGKTIRNSNIFGNKLKLTQHWYNGTTGILPVDDAIKMAFKDGYLHHILRLMVIGNIMNLSGIHPHEVYKWFMEFSLDSYDWVMVGNVYSMALWADGGLTMRKPYISSSAYILKMSTYSRDKWCEIWDNLFYNFINKNTKQLTKTYYAGLVNAWGRKPLKHRHEIIKKASQYLNSIK